MWTNHEGQDSPVSHGHNVNYNHTTPCNRGVYSLQANPGDDDDLTLTPNGSNNIRGDSHDSSLYSHWVCGMEGHLPWYCSKTVDRGRHEPDSHTLCSHMTHIASHDAPNLYNRWLLPQLGDLTLTLFIYKALKSPYGVSMVLYMNFTGSINTIIIN